MRKIFLQIQLLALLLASPLLIADDHPVSVPVGSDLAADARLSARLEVPILVMFSSDSCGYCRIVEEQFLIPMIISGDYTDKVIIRKVEIDSSDDMRDFTGTSIAMEDFAYREGVSFTPTIRFYGAGGTQLVPQMIGLTTVDYFGGYLDEAINLSRLKLQPFTSR